MSDKVEIDAKKIVDSIKKDNNLMAVAIGGVAIVVGLFLPWYTVSFLSVSTSISPGLNSTGILLLICSIAALGASLNLLKKDKKSMQIIAIAAAVVALFVMLNNWPDSDLRGAVSTGLGYWLGFLGSVAMIAGTVRMKMASKDAGSKPKSSDKK